ncbi:MAG: M20/M25/M40 family metallo-hydrolase [Acidobacteria bacterium]|nr:M20/M25/M40 family metallo-hydrolase [Acidobacteriota bacterium]
MPSWSRLPVLRRRAICLVAVCLSLVAVYAEPPVARTSSASIQQAIAQIQAGPMKGHVSFLASDLLEGRATPSRGLDIAAEYIASRFRAAALDMPPGWDSYYQLANWKQSRIPVEDARFRLVIAGTAIELDGTRFGVQSQDALALHDARVFKTRFEAAEDLKKLADGSLEGHVALILAGDQPQGRRSMGRMQQQNDLRTQLQRLKVSASVVVRKGDRGTGASPRLTDPQQSSASGRGFRLPFPVSVYSSELHAMMSALPDGVTTGFLTLKVPPAVESPALLRNVIGVLPGSDPELKDTYILVTAHYDHVGMGAAENGDSIFNGANDDASGIASVLEIANAFASHKLRPRRTIVFVALFGEERGLLGSEYYGRNPVFPLAKTVADINLEHMGRTDDDDGEHKGKVWVTGFDYTTMVPAFNQAGKVDGVIFEKHEKNSEAFYARSDNLALARAGIPSHTFCVAFEFPDYHGLGDHWEKIDYDNMAKVSRSIAGGLWMLANSTTEPAWSESSEKTEKYRKARAEQNSKTQPASQGNNR